ncbi:hypothetical protein PROFUN_04985 [Planoprotostelium fungivorum]|uniref:Uncharacterized protein n=1 Tax=Planoprotostelium fungivorum TaxID=1890364 RepID=A0A2P6NSR1_9EUKA|nr:hypothetical protein PROFUN_04985 [Planoprotostelium fungivorum]
MQSKDRPTDMPQRVKIPKQTAKRSAIEDDKVKEALNLFTAGELQQTRAEFATLFRTSQPRLDRVEAVVTKSFGTIPSVEIEEVKDIAVTAPTTASSENRNIVSIVSRNKVEMVQEEETEVVGDGVVGSILDQRDLYNRLQVSAGKVQYPDHDPCLIDDDDGEDIPKGHLSEKKLEDQMKEAIGKNKKEPSSSQTEKEETPRDDLASLLMNDTEEQPKRPMPDFPPMKDIDPHQLFTDPVESFELDDNFDYENVPFVPKGQFTDEEQEHLDSFRRDSQI